MKYHYVYRITNKLKRKHYYGVRGSTYPAHDLGVKYFSSSKDKDFIKDQKENPQDYRYKIVRIFENRKDAIFLEYTLHNKFDVAINESFYNKCKQTLNGFDNSGVRFDDEYKKRVYSNRISPMLGKKMPLESRKKMSKPKSIEHIEKIKINRAKQKICNNSIMHIF
jgi:hypothetical protein